ncbi:MAG: anion permease, partial [Propionicimonas sp.]|nr:anion permease [Propionicimonas sp.]
MSPEFILLALVVVTALAFDFTNGFHDTANAMATSIATKALSPKAAVTLCAILNLVGAFLSVEVAITVTNAVIRIQNPDGTPIPEVTADGGSALLLILLSGLAGAIIWNILTWLWGLPSSSSHALFGGLIGATIAGLGVNGVKWIGEGYKLDGVVGKVILPGFVSPAIAIIVATIGTRLVFLATKGVAERYQETGFRWGQIGTASLLSLSHGTNDAQKTMGVITLG